MAHEDLDDYEEFVNGVHPVTEMSFDELVYSALGCAEEGGEVAGVVKKMIREFGPEYNENYRLRIAKELGDMLYYLTRVAGVLGYDLNDIAYIHRQKIAQRDATT